MNDRIILLGYVLVWSLTNRIVSHSQEPTRLTQHGADLIGQDRVGVVQPAAAAQALSEAVEYGLIGEQHHQDPQSCCDRARVKMFLHEHQEPIKTERPDQLLTSSVQRDEVQQHQVKCPSPRPHIQLAFSE